jgi:hypothetical protein
VGKSELLQKRVGRRELTPEIHVYREMSQPRELNTSRERNKGHTNGERSSREQKLRAAKRPIDRTTRDQLTTPSKPTNANVAAHTHL